jgi:cytochrome c oxidase subunit 4
METSVERTKDEGDAPEHPDRHREELAHHPDPRQYVVVAVALAVATGLEVGLYYMRLTRSVLIGLLLFFAILKFALVVLYFMHLRFDNPIFRRMFITGMLLAISVYLVVLLAFRVLRPVDVLIALGILGAGLVAGTLVVSRVRGAMSSRSGKKR